MGWMFQQRSKGITHKAFFSEEFGRPEKGFVVLDVASGSVDRSAVYVAMKLPRGEVIAIACMTQWRPNDPYNFGYKDMDESMGPGISDCPERIFKLLSPLEDVFPGADFEADAGPKWAKDWRARVEAGHQRRRSRPKLRNGMMVKVPYDLRTIRANEPFEVVDAKRRIFSQGPYHRFKLQRRTQEDLEVVTQ